MFTAGRYEYRNKGVDMFIESLARNYLASPLYMANLISVFRLKLPAAKSGFYCYRHCLYHHACGNSFVYH